MWALVPLLIGAMTQPAGGVLLYTEPRGSSMRFSPFICAGDMMAFFGSLLYDHIVSPTASLEHFKTELAWRFESRDLGDSAGFIGRGAITRWALLILGGIPCQTIKLMAMGGIPWTKSFALMLFLPQLIAEILNLCASVYAAGDRAFELRVSGVPSKTRRGLRWLGRWQTFCHNLQLLAFGAVLIKLSLSVFQELGVDNSFTLFFNLLVNIVYSLFVCWFMYLESHDPFTYTTGAGCGFFFYHILFLYNVSSIFGLIFCIFLDEIWTAHPDNTFSKLVYISAWMVVSFSWGNLLLNISFAFYAVLPEGSIFSKKFLKIIGIPEEAEGREILVVIFVNFLVFLLGYCFLFDGRDTTDPA